MDSNYICSPLAQMAKLVDALPSGGSVRKDVLVRIQFWAHREKQKEKQKEKESEQTLSLSVSLSEIVWRSFSHFFPLIYLGANLHCI
jgi:hypothetical protein